MMQASATAVSAGCGRVCHQQEPSIDKPSPQAIPRFHNFAGSAANIFSKFVALQEALKPLLPKCHLGVAVRFLYVPQLYVAHLQAGTIV